MSHFLSQIDRLCSDWFVRSYGWTGIEIGCHGINMAQVRKLKNRWELSAVWSVEHPTPYSTDKHSEETARTETFGWIPNQDLQLYGLAPTLEYLENLHSLFRGKSCAATLTDGMIQYRELELPIGVSNEPQEFVHSEIALELESEEDELLTDCWDLQCNDPKNSTSCFGAVSIQRDVALRFANDLLKVGFDCKALDALPCAMARATQMVIDDTTNATLAVDVGYCQTSMTLVKNGQPLMARSIRNLGIITLQERIATSFDISLSDAETLLFQSTSQDEETEHSSKKSELSNPLHQKLVDFQEALVAELERTVHFANRVTRTSMPTQIILMGPGVRISSLARTVESCIGLPVHTWSIDCSENLFGQQEIATYAVATGLSALAWEGR